MKIYREELTTIISCLEKVLFPDELKIADMSPISNKDEDLRRTVRPVSIFRHIYHRF